MDEIVHFSKHQVCETLGIISQLFDKEGVNCLKSSGVSAVFISYYAQSSDSSYNLDEALEALLTLTTRNE